VTEGTKVVLALNALLIYTILWAAPAILFGGLGYGKLTIAWIWIAICSNLWIISNLPNNEEH